MSKLRLFFLLLISFNVSAETFQATIGVIAAENKPVEIKSKTLDGKIITRSVLIGQPVYLNDEITTQENNKIQILLKDQTAFSMGANSSIVVDKFVYDPNKPELTANIKQGAFKFVSGKISEMKKDTMKVSIPNSVIAVRGTSVAGSINPDGSSTVVLLHGAIGLTSGLNTTDITKAGYGAQISATGLISSPLPIPASTIKSITTSVQAQALNTGAPGTAATSTGSTTTTSTALSTTTSSSTSSSSIASPANNLNQIVATTMSSSQAQEYETAFSNYLQGLTDPGTTTCGVACASYNFFTLTQFQNAALSGLTNLGAVTFTSPATTLNVPPATGFYAPFTQTVTVNYANATLTNNYNINYGYYLITGHSSPPYTPVYSIPFVGTASTTFANLVSAGNNSTFLLPVAGGQQNLLMTGALGSPSGTTTGAYGVFSVVVGSFNNGHCPSSNCPASGTLFPSYTSLGPTIWRGTGVVTH